MKIHVLSDLHLEFAEFNPPVMNADVVVLAGDTHLGEKGIAWAQTHWVNVPVVYVLGNHEYYRHAHPKLLSDLQAKTRGSHIHILENEAFTFDGVTFLGCTLWTDFALLGEPRVYGQIAMQTMSDFKKIRISPGFSKMRSLDSAAIHKASRQWLEAELAARVGQKVVVVTHHAPSIQSLPAEFQDDPLSAAYASSLGETVKHSGALYWIHGHVHQAVQYTIGQTWMVSNPRGYPDENTGFDPALVLEV
jgi:Icc-related predicted phosphoesterase